ncbi:MAG: PepSY domain-containing protein [Gemmatimonadaceae bacterium]
MQQSVRFAAVIAAATALMAVSAGAASAQQAAPKTRAHHRTEAQQDSALRAEAKITPEQARATAQSKVPGGIIQSEELEREHGRIIYSFDIKVKGKSGIQEVNVNAMDGTVVNVEHESAQAEKKEKAKEQP